MRRSSSWIAVLPSLVIPVCLGLIMYLGLAYSINQSHITNDTILRYLTGHPVSKVTVGMFFIGLASLLLIANNVFEQFSAEKKITLGDSPNNALGTQPSEESVGPASVLAKDQKDRATPKQQGLASQDLAAPSVADLATLLSRQLSDLPKWLHSHYLWQRLQNGLYFAFRTGSTQGIEDELKYLADLDLDQQQQRYSLVQILIWATPMLGFLGTVLGISQALGGIDVGPDNNLQTMMDGLRGNLYIAFDTTALALTLSMLLMFGQFLIDRFETQLLLLVDQRAQGELNRHLWVEGDTESDSYQDLAQDIVEANRKSTEQQTEIWKKTIHSAEKAWASTLTDTNLQVQDSMSVALDENVANLAHYLGEAIDKADNAMTHRWQQWQVTLSENARLLAAQQNQLSEQTELLQGLILDKQQKASEPAFIETPVVQASVETKKQPEVPEVVDSPTPKAPAEDVEASEVVFRKPVDAHIETQRHRELPISVTRAVPGNSEHVVAIDSEATVAGGDDSGSKSKTVVNFQSYLDSILNRSTGQNSNPDSRMGERGTGHEVVLPFQLGRPGSSVDSDTPRSNDAA